MESPNPDHYHHIWGPNLRVWYTVRKDGSINIEQVRTPCMFRYRPTLDEQEQMVADLHAYREKELNDASDRIPAKNRQYTQPRT